MNKTFKRIILILGGLVLISFGLYKISALFALGSYPYAQTYELNFSEDKVIQAINKFKTDNPDYVVPKVKINNSGAFDLLDHRKDSVDHWYHIYFYLNKENIIVYAWTRPLTKDKTAFAFVSINNGLSIGNWQEINHVLSPNENDRIIKVFESEILSQIQNTLSRTK